MYIHTLSVIVLRVTEFHGAKVEVGSDVNVEPLFASLKCIVQNAEIVLSLLEVSDRDWQF